MSGNILNVYNAQMAVSTPEKYPEFAGNVKTVDTRKFWPDEKLDHKGRDWDYKNNAETFLQIGKTLGQAMIELMKTHASPRFSKHQIQRQNRPN